MNIFVATPISSLGDSEKFTLYKKEVCILTDYLLKSYNVNAELLGIESVASYDTPEKSLSIDMEAISMSDVFILHHPEKVTSSTLIELGFAIAKKKFIIVITPSVDTLPYLALGLGSLCDAAIIINSSIDEKCLLKVQNALNKYDQEKVMNEWNKLFS